MKGFYTEQRTTQTSTDQKTFVPTLLLSSNRIRGLSFFCRDLTLNYSSSQRVWLTKNLSLLQTREARTSFRRYLWLGYMLSRPLTHGDLARPSVRGYNKCNLTHTATKRFEQYLAHTFFLRVILLKIIFNQITFG